MRLTSCGRVTRPSLSGTKRGDVEGEKEEGKGVGQRLTQGKPAVAGMRPFGQTVSAAVLSVREKLDTEWTAV